MFGKGVYFADMISKSLGYCRDTNNESLLLLCEVACGEFYENFESNYIEKLPENYNS